MAVVLHVGAGTRVADAPDGGFAPPQHHVLAGIYKVHYDRLMGFFVRRTHDRALAEDLAHDTMVRLVRSSDTFDATRPAWPYLKVAATNVLIDHLRRADRQVDVDVEEQLESEDVCEPCVDDQVVLRAMLDQAMDLLPERQRIAVDLRYERGWTVSDGAEFLGVSPGTFSQLLFRARQTMREYLENTATGVSGVVLPVLLALRGRLRTWTARLREVTQSPVSAAGVDAVMSVVVAVSLSAVAMAINTAPISGEPTTNAPHFSPVAVPSVASPARAVTTAASTSSPIVLRTPSALTVGTEASDSEATTTRVATPELPTEDAPSGNLALEDSEERVAVAHEINSRTGTDIVVVEGDVHVECDGLVGDVVCDLGSQ